MAPATKAGELGEVSDTDVLIQGYCTYLSGLRKSERTVEEYVKDVRRWAIWWRRPVEFFGQPEWDDWMAYLSSTGVKGSSVNRYRCSLKRFYRYLRRRKVVEHDPSYDSESVKTEDRLPEIASMDEIRAMKRKLKAPRTRALFALLYDCGLRSREARELTIERIGLDSVRVSGKGAKDRVVPFTPETGKIIGNWLEIRPKGTVYVFPTAGGNSIDEPAVYKLVSRVAKAVCPQKHLSPHSLRHSIATHLVELGWPLEKVQAFLGHSSIETTRRYVRIAIPGIKSQVLSSHPSLPSVSP